MDFKGSQFERDIILWGVRWYVAYPISYRQLEEMMQERGVEVDHSSLNRWVIKYTPALEKAFRQRKRSVGTSWRLDETYIRVKGKRVARPRSLTTIMSVEIRYAAATANRFRCSSRSGVFPAYLVTTRQDPSH